MTVNQRNQKWLVHKFGGTSVGNAERYSSVIHIINGEKKTSRLDQAIVVSAMKGTTDQLIQLVELAKNQDTSYLALIEKIRERHLLAIETLKISHLKSVFEKDLNNVLEILKGIGHVKNVSERTIEYISGLGEVWSAQILTAAFIQTGVPAVYLDAREVLIVEPHTNHAVVQWELSQTKLDAWLKTNRKANEYVVITGFVASTQDGIATTLKRNGSDFSGSIFGRLFDAKEIIIWTDVDGVLSADPRLISDAKVLNEMSYEEVTELANFGAKVVHPATMDPAVKKGIPVWIRNTFNPTFHGTKIHAHPQSDEIVKGFSAIENVALINVEGSGMIGISGIASRLFSALAEAKVSVVMISQACSEYSICFAVAENKANLAKQVIEKAFYAEIHQGLLDHIEVKLGLSILAAVGDNMISRPGVAGRFFTALGNSGVSINAIAQGSSERNISAVIDGSKTAQALRAVHSEFYSKDIPTTIGLIGTGNVAQAFLGLLKEQSKQNPLLRLELVMNSRELFVNKKENGFDYQKSSPTEASLEQFTQNLANKEGRRVVIDLSSSDTVSDHYSSWLAKGFHVVSANKKANTRSFAEYQELRKSASLAHAQFLYSTNVGAGLPILSTIKNLYQSGDRLKGFDGILSGTLSYLFNLYDGTIPFSELVLKAKSLSYTEPDPRDDLNGMDVARKLVIIAREAGIPLELNQIHIESLVPEKLKTLKLDQYLAQVANGDQDLLTRFQAAQKQNQVIRFVASLDQNGKASVGLKAFPKSHPFARLVGSDNIIAIQTDRYSTNPLIIQGPGAGALVTASGVYSDLLKLGVSVKA